MKILAAIREFSTILFNKTDNTDLELKPSSSSADAEAEVTISIPDTADDTIALLAASQTLTNKTLTTPKINDTSSDHTYDITPSELTADRTITLPLLTGNDTLAFEDHTQTLSNKTLKLPKINDISDNNTYTVVPGELVADRNINLPVLGADDTVAFEDHTQTLTNKTIDADSNTITNIDNADIKAAAAIDQSKLATLTADKAAITNGSGVLTTSSVSSTEVGYLAGVSSAIQTQLNAKAGTALDNLASVAINTSLISDTDNTDDLGSSSIAWKDAWLRNIKVNGSTSGTLTVTVPATVTSYSVSMPSAQGAAGTFLKNDGSGGLTWEAPPGGGDVVGPASATDNAVVRYDSTTGKLIQNSGVIVDDSDNVSGIGTLTATSLAGTLTTAAQTNVTSVGTLSSLDVTGDLTVDTNTLHVDSTNNRVGVGTTSPDSPMEVASANYDGVRVSAPNVPACILEGSRSNPNEDVGLVRAYNGASRVSEIEFTLGKSGGTTSGQIHLRTSSSGTMQTNLEVHHDRTVGIGATPASSNERFVVDALGETNGRMIFQQTTLGSSQSLEQQVIASSRRAGYGVNNNGNGITGFHRLMTPGGGPYYLWVDNSGDYRLSSTDGNIGSNSAGIVVGTQTSDSRLKQNITNTAKGLTEINNLRPVSFQYTSNPGQDKLGFLAQEAVNYVPEAVYQTGDTKEGIEDYYAMDYSSLIPVLVKAVQELSAKVDALEAAQNP